MQMEQTNVLRVRVRVRLCRWPIALGLPTYNPI